MSETAVAMVGLEIRSQVFRMARTAVQVRAGARERVCFIVCIRRRSDQVSFYRQGPRTQRRCGHRSFPTLSRFHSISPHARHHPTRGYHQISLLQPAPSSSKSTSNAGSFAFDPLHVPGQGQVAIHPSEGVGSTAQSGRGGCYAQDLVELLGSHPRRVFRKD